MVESGTVETINGVSRPKGWEFYHEHDAELIRRDGLMCEKHPGIEWPHADCAGPGQAWVIEGRVAIQTATANRRLTKPSAGHPHYFINMKPFREAQAKNQEMFTLELAVCEAAIAERRSDIAHAKSIGSAPPYSALTVAVDALIEARKKQTCQQI